MSPRVIPRDERDALATVFPPSHRSDDPAPRAGTERARRAAHERDIDVGIGDPYRAQYAPEGTFTDPSVPVHSYFRDRLLIAESEERAKDSLERALRGGGRGGFDPGPSEPPAPGFAGDSFADARARLTAAGRRDLSSTGAPDMLKPSAPGWLADFFGRAARQTGTLASVFRREPLEPGMVETTGGQQVLRFPRLVSGAAVAVQSAENANVQETDPTTGSTLPPVGTIAGQVDMSRQVFDLSRPGLDEAVADDLGRAHGTVLDAQIVNGSGAGQNVRGFLNISGILSVAGAVTNVQVFSESVWKAFSALAGTSGVGNPDPANYVTILSPRRYAWWQGASGSSAVPAVPALPGTVVASGGVPTNLGAGTEDVALVVERSSVVLVGGSPAFRVFPEVGSTTLTVRIPSWNFAALVVASPVAVARVTGLTAPTGY